MPSAVTIGERILLHLSQFSKYSDNFDAPPEVSQDGIAEALRISRAHAAIELKKLKEFEEVSERLSHIRHGPTKRKVYFLTDKGESRAKNLRDYVAREGIELAPLLDLRRCRASDLWKATPPEMRPVLGAASVFRRPFRRTALPPTTVTLLPEDADGMVDLPKEIKDNLPALIDPAQLSDFHSHAADYWLREGDRRERLYHLLRAGRGKEAEMLLASHGSQMSLSSDRDLFDLVMAVPCQHNRYGPRIREVRGTVARSVAEHLVALKVSEEQIASDDIDERLKGIKLKGGVLADRQEFPEAYKALVSGRGSVNGVDIDLECAIAEVLIAQGKADEAKGLIQPLLCDVRCTNDLNDLEKLYLEMGRALLGNDEPREAIKFLSKAMGLARPGDKRHIYESMSMAYLSIGMQEKGKEYALKAGIKRQDWTAACPSQ
jgi:DNA-binding MarR family transcriptional regulator